MNRSLSIHTPHGPLYGQFDIPVHPRALVLLARARHAPIDAAMAARLAEFGFATLTMELLTSQESQFADATQNVPRLTQRLMDLLELIQRDGDLQSLPLAVLANGDTAPAAIRVAARRDTQVRALACHGGLIDRSGREALEYLKAPLLILFDQEDKAGEAAFQRAVTHLANVHEEYLLQLLEDPVIPLAAWLKRHLGSDSAIDGGQIMDFQ